jgi:hypothetical protein
LSCSVLCPVLEVFDIPDPEVFFIIPLPCFLGEDPVPKSLNQIYDFYQTIFHPFSYLMYRKSPMFDHSAENTTVLIERVHSNVADLDPVGSGPFWSDPDQWLLHQVCGAVSL